ncbi:MAG TPA: metallophosphoesterase [Steroidobacteraceae bacterium]|nr:metallophosphoesterase [Steroidobacteraceae bacterium]
MRVLQFTDPHLTGSPDMRVRGVATAATLARCVAHAKRRHPRPDAVLLTGDLVHDDPRGYATLRERFADSGAPVHCLPGNHDDPQDVSGSLDGAPFVHDFARRYGDWVIVMLDSTIAGEHGGRLDAAELARLDAALAAQPGAHALVCLHHHPVPHGSAWLDELMLGNADEFFEVLARHPGVRGLAWGHTHQPFEGMHGRIRLMGTPSTCMQFTQNAAEFAIDDRPPAYRWIELGPAGGIETGIEWVGEDG